MAQVVGAAGQREGVLGGGEGGGAGGGPVGAVGAVLEDAAACGAEDPPVRAGAVALEVGAEELDQDGRDGDGPGSRAGRGASGPGPGGRCRRRSSRGRRGARRRPGRCGPSGGRKDGSRSRGASRRRGGRLGEVRCQDGCVRSAPQGGPVRSNTRARGSGGPLNFSFQFPATSPPRNSERRWGSRAPSRFLHGEPVDHVRGTPQVQRGGRRVLRPASHRAGRQSASPYGQDACLAVRARCLAI